jgi:outer membrane protein assembly factor BamD (BamD/ComL family)
MSVSGISSSSFYDYNYNGGQNVQSTQQQFVQDFQQLGQDLQSGNLSAAQNDFATLQQLMPQNNGSTAAAQSSTSTQNNPIAQEFSQLSQDLQAGNLSAAQSDFATLQQDFQSQASQTHGHHHHHGGGEGQGQGGQIGQLLSQLGQALQSGNLSSAQQAYSSLLQDFQQFGQGNAQTSQQVSSQNTSSTVSVSA